MNEEFAGKVALVTGGGSDIDAATCHALAKAGAYVAVLYRDAAAAERIAGEVGKAGGQAAAHTLDVADGAAFARVATAVAKAQGGIDVPVNCAGTITRHKIAHKQTLSSGRIQPCKPLKKGLARAKFPIWRRYRSGNSLANSCTRSCCILVSGPPMNCFAFGDCPRP